ncbi:MAG: alanine racemase [bacterium]|jgi:alanine racemase
MQDTSTIDIDLAAIDHNMSVIRRVVGDRCALCPIVKADAYGLGVSRVARRLVAAGAEMLAVYSLRQAIETAAAVNGTTPILVLMPVTDIAREDELVRLMLGGQLHLVVHDEANLAALEACAQSIGVTLPVHLEIDVGMSRGGARPDEAARILQAIHDGGRLSLRGIFAHFSHSRCDAAITARQLEAYDSVVTANRHLIPDDVIEHVASTYALARSTRYHRSMVRFGLAWLGYGLEELDAPGAIMAPGDLRPVVRWSSQVVQAKEVPAGTAVGYGARWTAPRDSTVVLVPVGYADGFPTPRDAAMGAPWVRLHAPNGAVVDAPVVGAVNMDQITVDVTGLHDGDPRSWIGCAVELISRDRVSKAHLPNLARAAGMIVHEALTRLNPRIARTVSTSISSPNASCTIEVVVPRAAEASAQRLGSAVG